MLSFIDRTLDSKLLAETSGKSPLLNPALTDVSIHGLAMEPSSPAVLP